MPLSTHYLKRAEVEKKKRADLVAEKAKVALDKLFASEQFKYSAFAVPEGQMAVDAIVNTVANTAVDPVNEYVDTLRIKGYRLPEIRFFTDQLYKLYIVGPTEVQETDATVVTFEEQLPYVAAYVREHQEVYATIKDVLK